MTARAVFDCMVFVQAFANARGPASSCLRLAQNGSIDLCLSPDVLREVGDVLSRPKLRKKLPALTAERVGRLLDDLIRFSTWITAVPVRFTYGRDPKDEPYINLAIAARARYLVSRDKDLLDLGGDEAFRQQFPDLLIVEPVAFLQAIASEGSEGMTGRGES